MDGKGFLLLIIIVSNWRIMRPSNSLGGLKMQNSKVVVYKNHHFFEFRTWITKVNRPIILIFFMLSKSSSQPGVQNYLKWGEGEMINKPFFIYTHLLVSVELSTGHFGHIHVSAGQVVVGGPGAIVVLLLSLLSDVELFEEFESFESFDSFESLESSVFVSLFASDLFLLVKVSWLLLSFSFSSLAQGSAGQTQ